MKTATRNELIQYIIDKLNEGTGHDVYGCDLHNELFNTDYYLIGYYYCEQWLINNTGIFNAIEEIKEYEQDNFGEVTTDLSEAERVVNMWVYIEGEKVLSESETLQNNWDKILDEEDIKTIISELEAL